MDTQGCPESGNTKAYWWIEETDSGDEPSTQFFRCTECNIHGERQNHHNESYFLLKAHKRNCKHRLCYPISC